MILKWKKNIFICFLPIKSASTQTPDKELKLYMKYFENSLYVKCNFVVSNAFYQVEEDLLPRLNIIKPSLHKTNVE